MTSYSDQLQVTITSYAYKLQLQLQVTIISYNYRNVHLWRSSCPVCVILVPGIEQQLQITGICIY